MNHLRQYFDGRIEELRDLVERLEASQEKSVEDVGASVERLSRSIEGLSTVILEHVLAESKADAKRDSVLIEHSGSLAQLAADAGRVAGTASGGPSGAKWGGVVGGILFALATILEKVLK
jgi:hypothetical protein